MATVNQDVLKKFRNATKLPLRPEGDGNEVQFDVREDEEQSIKSQEIFDILVAAGYFRARIKGLSEFDKIVGGMVWCIESCNIGIDVDLLFRENSTIKQKIALTEKIVSVLPKMKCPHAVEPHQIQGLDFIHIFPVIQWLVKRSMENRKEIAAYVRSYAVNQFKKEFETGEVNTEKYKNFTENVNLVNETYRPHRFYKRKNAPPPDIDSRVQITLLEYGHRGGSIRKINEENSNEESNAENEQVDQQQIERLLSNLAITTEDAINFEDLSREEKEQFIKHYNSLHTELKEGGVKSKEEKQVEMFKEQFDLLMEKCVKLEKQQKQKESEVNQIIVSLEDIRLKKQEADRVLKEIESEISNASSNIDEVEELIKTYDKLKAQEIKFKQECEEELVRLQNLIEEKKQTKAKSKLKDISIISKEIEEESEKVRVLRLQLAKKNRMISALQRQIDDVPNRAELAQYQQRFLELYNQVAAKHKETKQYFTLYNTLEDTRTYMQKELSLLNSISENYPDAMQSMAGKEEFLQQFNRIIEGVKQSKMKVEQKLMGEKQNRDRLSRTLQGLVELQRKYVAAVRELSMECNRHEALLASRN